MYIQGLFYRSGIAGLAQLKTYWSRNLQKRVKRGSQISSSKPVFLSQRGSTFERLERDHFPIILQLLQYKSEIGPLQI